MLHTAGKPAGCLKPERIAFDIKSIDSNPLSTFERKTVAWERKTPFFFVMGVGLCCGHLAESQPGVNDAPAGRNTIFIFHLIGKNS